nr:hypothetical protein [uncultured Carboxylicivirga sp.]
MKRFGLLILVAVLGSALTIGTFNVLDLKSNQIVKSEIVSASSHGGILFDFNQQGDVDSVEFDDFFDDVLPVGEISTSSQLSFFSNYHQQIYVCSFLTCFDNDPFSQMYRSSV